MIPGRQSARRSSTMTEFSDRLLSELIDAVKQLLRKEAAERLREWLYWVDTTRSAANVGEFIEAAREEYRRAAESAGRRFADLASTRRQLYSVAQ